MNRAEAEAVYKLNDSEMIEFNNLRVSFKDDEFIIAIKKETDL